MKSKSINKGKGAVDFAMEDHSGPLHFSICLSIVPITRKIKAKLLNTAHTGLHKIWS